MKALQKQEPPTLFKSFYFVFPGKLGEVSTPDDLYMFCVKEPGQWRCGVCSDYTNNGRNHVRNHVESKHFPNTFQYQCPQCDKTSNTKKGMDVHKSKKHGNVLNASVQSEHGVWMTFFPGGNWIQKTWITTLLLFVSYQNKLMNLKWNKTVLKEFNLCLLLDLLKTWLNFGVEVFTE